MFYFAFIEVILCSWMPKVVREKAYRLPPPGIEPRISCSVGRRLIHWARGALAEVKGNPIHISKATTDNHKALHNGVRMEECECRNDSRSDECVIDLYVRSASTRVRVWNNKSKTDCDAKLDRDLVNARSPSCLPLQSVDLSAKRECMHSDCTDDRSMTAHGQRRRTMPEGEGFGRSFPV